MCICMYIRVSVHIVFVHTHVYIHMHTHEICVKGTICKIIVMLYKCKAVVLCCMSRLGII